jgi:hypothetical protein
MVQVMWERALPAKGATRFVWYTAYTADAACAAATGCSSGYEGYFLSGRA